MTTEVSEAKNLHPAPNIAAVKKGNLNAAGTEMPFYAGILLATVSILPELVHNTEDGSQQIGEHIS